MKKSLLLFLLPLAALAQPTVPLANTRFSGTNNVVIDAASLKFGTTTPASISGAAGALTFTGAGTNQNITLTPSGAGRVNVVVGANNGISQYISPVSQLSASNNVTMAVGDALSSGRAVLVGTLRDGSGNYLGIMETFSGGAPIALNRSGGNVLLGTTTDSSNGRLQLAAGTGITQGIGFGTDISTFRSAANQFDIAATGSLTARLVSATNALNFYLYESGTSLTGAITSNGGAITLRSIASTLALWSNNTVALTLDSSQNATFAHKVTLNSTGGTTTADALYFGTDTALYRGGAGNLRLGGTAGNTSLDLVYNSATTNATMIVNATDFLIGAANASGSLIMRSGGNVAGITLGTTQLVRFNAYGAGTITSDASGNLTSVSDERLKDIQRSFTTGLSAINKIKPITFKWNAKSGMETEHEYSGFSAQNVQAAMPEGVGQNKDGILSLQDRAILAALVNAVNELDRRSPADWWARGMAAAALALAIRSNLRKRKE